MANTLQGKIIAILAADGVERVEFEQPRDAIIDAGGQVVVLSLKTGMVLEPITPSPTNQR